MYVDHLCALCWNRMFLFCATWRIFYSPIWPKVGQWNHGKNAPKRHANSSFILLVSFFRYLGMNSINIVYLLPSPCSGILGWIQFIIYLLVSPCSGILGWIQLTSYFSMLLKKHMLTDPIIFEIIISQNQHN